MQSRAWMVVSLVLTCLIAAFALSQVYAATKPKIDYQRNVEGLRKALVAVLPAAVDFRAATPDSTVWHGFDATGVRVGSVIKVAKQGYGGPVPVAAGIDLEGRVIAIRVAPSSEGLKETPGLGLKATDEVWRAQFRGLAAGEVRLDKEGNGPIAAISGATITSRAVTSAVREGMEKYADYLKP